MRVLPKYDFVLFHWYIILCKTKGEQDNGLRQLYELATGRRIPRPEGRGLWLGVVNLLLFCFSSDILKTIKQRYG